MTGDTARDSSCVSCHLSPLDAFQCFQRVPLPEGNVVMVRPVAKRSTTNTLETSSDHLQVSDSVVRSCGIYSVVAVVVVVVYMAFTSGRTAQQGQEGKENM